MSLVALPSPTEMTIVAMTGVFKGVLLPFLMDLYDLRAEGRLPSAVVALIDERMPLPVAVSALCETTAFEVLDRYSEMAAENQRMTAAMDAVGDALEYARGE
jgi:hypothetical protein